jgi:serine/threonine protein kinase
LESPSGTWRLKRSALLPYHSAEINKLFQANILINDGGQACLTDFGLSVVSTGQMTQAYAASIRWSAPEVLCHSGDERDVRKRDIYSFACSVLEVCSVPHWAFCCFHSNHL